MALNIKNAEVEDLARRLATATGTSITAAVARALREELARTSDDLPGEAVADRARRAKVLAKEIAPCFRGELATIDHGDLLYARPGYLRDRRFLGVDRDRPGRTRG